MKEKLSTKPFFLFLFPLFFVLHGYAEYFQFYHFPQLLPFLCWTLLASGLLWILFRWLLKDSLKGALMTIYILAFYLLFGAMFDFLKANSPWVIFFRYRTLVSSFLIIGIFLFFYFRKSKKRPSKVVLFLNILILIYLVVDMGTIAGKQFSTKKEQLVYNLNPGNGLIPDSCQKPDIYLLLFDGNASTLALKELWGYDNSEFDSFLVSRKFHLLPRSRSNYNVTQVSMASMLNMDLVHWLDTAQRTTHTNYVKAGIQIRENEVAKFLSHNGYEIVNYSIFDLHNNPSPVNQRWRTLNANLLNQGTFLARFTDEFHNQLIGNATIRKWLPVFAYGDQMDNNEYCFEATKKEAGIQRTKPRFVYTHILAPHFPYFRDRDGKLRPREKPGNEGWETGVNNPYTNYVYYNNGEIRKLVDTILNKTNGRAVILLLGDHGFHVNMPDELTHLKFNNQCAVYLPGGQYDKYYDSVTNINQFRILFNTLFAQQYPMMKDSCIMVNH